MRDPDYIAILETGSPPAGLDQTYGTYAEMFEGTLAREGRTFRVFRATQGELPPAHDERLKGVVITGSPSGVYESDPWIQALLYWLRALDRDIPAVGICFGHQIMAQAYGGRVEKSARGWGVGLHHYDIALREPWMDSTAPIAVAVSHQDQVVEPPPGARVIGGSAFTPFGLLDFGDGAVSMQCHPEFDPAYATALIEARSGVLGALAAPAVQSLQAPNDRGRVGGWIRCILAQDD